MNNEPRTIADEGARLFREMAIRATRVQNWEFARLCAERATAIEKHKRMHRRALAFAVAFTAGVTLSMVTLLMLVAP